MSDRRPTIRVILYKSKHLSNGEFPIMLVVSYKGTRKYKSLGISCAEKDWNEEKGEVKTNHPQAKLINNTITSKITEIQSQYLSFEKDEKQYSASSLLNAVKRQSPTNKTLFSLIEERVNYFRNVTQTNNTADGYNTLNQTFKKFLNNKDIELFLIDEDWITSYELWLRQKYKDTSIKRFFERFKAAFNYAVKKKYVEKSPLDNYEHVKKLNLSTTKRALSLPEITNLTLYYLNSYGLMGEKTTPVTEVCKKHYWNKWFKRRGTTKLTPIDAEQLSLALYLCSYYFQGLALVDLAKLKWRDLKEITILDANQYAYLSAKYSKEYADENTDVKECYQIDLERSKTGKPVKIVVERSIVTPFLNPFFPDGDFDDEEIENNYIFPIYSDIDNTEYKRYCRMRYATYLVNVNLKRIGSSLNIPNLTFYSARHTYASTLYHSDVPMSLIAQNMGRNPADIETYLKEFDNAKILEANAKTSITGNLSFKKGLEDKPKNTDVIMAQKKKEDELRLRYEKYGGQEAYGTMIKEKFEALDKELQELFGDNNQAKIEYLRAKNSHN